MKAQILKVYYHDSYCEDTTFERFCNEWVEVTEKELEELKDAVFKSNRKMDYSRKGAHTKVLLVQDEGVFEEVFKDAKEWLEEEKKREAKEAKRKAEEAKKKEERALERKRKQLEKLKKELEE